MAPFEPHSSEPIGLSERHLRILAAGVRGGDGPDDPPAPAAGDPAPAATTDPPAPAPAETDPAAPAGDAPPAEGDPPTPLASIPELPADLAAEDPEALRALATSIVEAREALVQNARTEDDLAAIAEASARRNAIAAELQRRVDEAQRVRAGVQEQVEAFANEPALPEPEPALASMSPARPPAAVIAAARGEQAPAAQQASASPARTRPRAALVAAVGTDGAQVGQTMDFTDLGEALDRTKNSEARSIVASLQPFSETRDLDVPLLGRESIERNTELMLEARDEWYAARRADRDGSPMTAAICEPLDILREIPDAFVTDEPIRDLFPTRPASRGGFQFFTSAALSSVNGSVDLWDETDQAAVSPTNQATWKPCIVVACPTATSIKAEAIVACLIWDNTQEMSNPESIANLMNALRAWRARRKEGRILERIDALSHPYVFATDYGAASTMIAGLNSAFARATYLNRQAENEYVAIVPPGALGAVATDLGMRGFGSDEARDTVRYILDHVPGLREIRASLDPSLAGEPSLPFPALPAVGGAVGLLPTLSDAYRIRLVEPGAAIYSETGQVNVGTTTDASLLRQNRTMYFSEEYLFLAKQGPAPWIRIDMDLCVNGARAGWVTPTACGDLS